MTSAIREHVQGLNLGMDITLYEIDLTSYNLGFIRVYEGDEGAVTDSAGPISFGGVLYNPWPIRTSGWRQGGGGSLPRPRFAVSNVNRVFTPMVRAADGFKYAPFRRVKTYERYLDFNRDGTPNPNADGTQHKPVDIYEINRIALEGEIEGVEVIQWELRTPIDRPNSSLPKITLVREVCQRTYRVFDPATGDFNYEGVDCPYVGAISYDENNEETTAENDVCPHFLRNCSRRFGENAVLPFLGFPGIERVRLR